MNARQERLTSRGLCGVCGKRKLFTALRCKKCQRKRLDRERARRPERTAMPRLLIDNDIRNALRPLSDEEKRRLHASLSAEGCRDKLTAWRQAHGPAVLVDGHHRKDYCDKKKIKYEVDEREFASKEDAIQWAKDHQEGRRNLSPEELSYHRGKRYQEEKQEAAGRPPENPPSESSDNSVTVTELSKGATAERIAAEEGVSPRTVERDAEFAAAVDTLKEADPPAAQAALNGEMPRREAVRRARKKKAEPETAEDRADAPDPVRDGYGNEIPEHLAEVFAARLILKECLSLGRKLAAKINDLANHPGGAFYRATLEHKGDEGNLKHSCKLLHQSLDAIKQHTPHSSVCPRCHHEHEGQVDPKCPLCKGAGWVTKHALRFAEKPHREAVEEMGKRVSS